MGSQNARPPRFAEAAQTNSTVFVVEDDVPTRSSMELLLRSEGWHAETFGSTGELLARQRAIIPSCLLLTLRAANIADLDVQEQIARSRPEMPIIVLCAQGDIRTTVRAMKAGAVELLVRPCSDGMLLSAVRQAIECSRATLERELETIQLRKHYASLSGRERQVMELVVDGLLNKQVGVRLGISEITVKAHRGRVMRKMQADSLAHLVVMACRLEAASEPAPFVRQAHQSFTSLTSHRPIVQHWDLQVVS